MIKVPTVNYELLKDRVVDPYKLSREKLVDFLVECHGDMLTAIACRRYGNLGIAVDTDPDALSYQVSDCNFRWAVIRLKRILEL